MSYLRALPLVLLAGAVGCNGTTNKPDMGTTRTLVLLHTNDRHSHILGFGPELDDYPAATAAGSGAIHAGVGRMAAIFASEKAKAQMAGADVLLVGAGDVMQGALTQVANQTKGTDFTIMKKLGYDASTLGNHEFDYGPDGLAKILQAAMANGGVVPTVASNIHFSSSDPGDDTLAALFDESGTDMSKPLHRSLVVTTPNGLKVGFVGILGADGAKSAPFKSPVTFSLGANGKETDYAAVDAQLYKDIQPVVDHLRNDLKCDLVIALSHSGVDSKNDANGEDTNIATHVNGIDVVVSGHTHTVYQAKVITNPNTGKPVLVQQAGFYGLDYGKITINVAGDGTVSFDMANSHVFPIDDTTVSDPSYNADIDGIIKTAEAATLPNGKDFVATTLSEITGMTLMDDPAKVGDLYFYPLGKIGFDLPGYGTIIHREDPVSVLSADADLAAAEEYGGPTSVAIQAEGVVRADINKGKTGVVSFGDVYRTLPLGTSLPDGTVGYPLCRFWVLAGAMKSALELTAGYSYESDNQSSFFLVTSGARFEYDTSKPEFVPPSAGGNPLDPNNGRVQKITFASNHTTLAGLDTYDTPVWDASQGGFVGSYSGATFIPVVANFYVTAFANSLSVDLYGDQNGTTTLTPEQALIKRKDGSLVQDWEALGEYIMKQSQANGGTLPASYDPAGSPGYPRRAICNGPLCVK